MIVHETHFYVDALGNLLGGFGDGAMPSDPNAVRVMTAPNHGKDTWDGAGWVTTPPTAEDVRAERDGLLLELDAYVSNPLRWAELEAPTKALWAAYRTALLDVPQQAGFPDTVTWPTKP